MGKLPLVGADVFFHGYAVTKPAEGRRIGDGLDDDDTSAGLDVFADILKAGAQVDVVEDELHEDEVECLFFDGYVGSVGYEKFGFAFDSINAGALLGELNVFGGNVEACGLVANQGELDTDFAVAAAKIEDGGRLKLVYEAEGVFLSDSAMAFAVAIACDLFR